MVDIIIKRNKELHFHLIIASVVRSKTSLGLERRNQIVFFGVVGKEEKDAKGKWLVKKM